MLFDLGAGEQIVGVTSYCNYPPAAQSITQIGGFSSKSISLERVVSLNPDLVVSSGGFHAPIIDEIERLGLPVLALSGETFGELRDELTLLGRVTGHAEQAATLVETIDERIDALRKASATIPPAERVRVYYHIWGEPLMGAGPTSYQGEMIEMCGGINIIDDASTRFPKLSSGSAGRSRSGCHSHVGPSRRFLFGREPPLAPRLERTSSGEEPADRAARWRSRFPL